MTSLLYPRLLPSETARAFDALHGRTLAELEAQARVSTERSVFAASGGQRASSDQIEFLQSAIVEAAKAAGYPAPPRQELRTHFDRRTAQILLERTGMVLGEASQPQVWAFLGLIVLPHVCAWRFPARPDGTYVADRFKGTDLTRHALGRLWTRAFILRDPEPGNASDAYRLMDILGEADLDQIMARRDSVAATPALVRSVIRTYRDSLPERPRLSARQVLRETLMRLLRLLAFLDIDGYTKEELDVFVAEVRSDAVGALVRASA